eukprot:TRINITY_DN6817_c0_g2_i3.p1 TRINITY_DN6817_c0_g2~~TRINITY_DN6817_c0_g2_i3.p1  ORF type:complete len:743 (-),score=100.25 TRINITY_DN6817_c0_g2_i3:302-2470(-)
MVDETIPDRETLAEREYFNQPTNFPFGDFDLDEVVLPDDDDIGIPSEDEELEEEQLFQEDTGFEKFVIVDNIPVVGDDKYQKLRDHLFKLFGKVGTIHPETGFVMPKNETSGKYQGFAFLEFKSAAEAKAAVAQFDNFRLDKNHIFRVNHFDDLDKFKKVEKEYKPLESFDYIPKDDFMKWLEDERGRDQFIMSYQNETEVHWNDAQRKESERVHHREFWSEGPVNWSPQGRYLSTMLSKGIALWGGTKFQRFQRLPHSYVSYISFSPDENYTITASAQIKGQRGNAVFQVWDVRSGRKLRVFQGPIQEFQMGTPPPFGQKHRDPLPHPVFKWSGGQDGRFIAKMSTDMVSVYELPEMNLLDKKSIKLEMCQDFEWCPNANIMCVFQAGVGDANSRVSLIELPSKAEIRQKSLFSVAEARLRWHPQGTFLAVVVERYTKTKKSTIPGFEFFRVKEKGIPMDVMQLQQQTDKVFDFFWEPKGERFVVLHGNANSQRPNISFYTMEADSKASAKGAKFLQTLPSKDVSQVLWSPQGKHVVFAGIKGNEGKLEFFNADDMTSFGIHEHFMCNHVEWDPSGRYFVSAVTIQKSEMENGFTVWSFAGYQIYKVMKDNFIQFQWRPRPPIQLSPEDEKEVMKNLKSYSRKFEEDDRAQAASASSEVLKKREALDTAWQEWYNTKQDWSQKNQDSVRKILGAAADIGECVTEMVEVEQEINTKEEVYQS